MLRSEERRSRQLANSLRSKMPDAEVILWSRLRRDGLPGMRFRRQHPIGPYIADFACPLSKLVIEVDGGTHSTDVEIAHDRRRDTYMRAKGWRVFRVTNEDVYKHLNEVLDGIVRFVPPPPPAAAPPP